MVNTPQIEGGIVIVIVIEAEAETTEEGIGIERGDMTEDMIEPGIERMSETDRRTKPALLIMTSQYLLKV